MSRKIKYTSWFFNYRGHSIEVSQGERFPESSPLGNLSGFTYYILTKNIDDDLTAIQNRFEAGDFHSGITYCRRFTVQSFSNPDPEEKWQADHSYLKIGCDYAHAWDDGRETFEDVCRDAERTVDNLIKAKIIEGEP